MAEQITTAEELDAAPVGTVVRDARSARLGEVRNTGGHNSVMFVGRTGNTWATDLRRFGHLPLVVVSRPDAPAPSDEAPEDFAAAVESMRGEMSAGAYLYLRDRLAARSSQPSPSVSAEQVVALLNVRISRNYSDSWDDGYRAAAADVARWLTDGPEHYEAAWLARAEVTP